MTKAHRYAPCRLLILGVLAMLPAGPTGAAETIWLEAEHLDGIHGYCWPMGPAASKKTAGHWGLSGPGWAAEWSQGSESGFLSIATAADDDHAAATTNLEIPTAGKYNLWVRYGDWREQPEPFEIVVEQPGSAASIAEFGRRARVEEDNEMKLYWGWAFAWDQQSVALAKGPARLTLRTTSKAAEPRQVDVIVLTTDADYRPLIKERPLSDTRRLLADYRTTGLNELEPLTRERGRFDLPEAWKLHTFRDQGFLYLWNVSHTNSAATWLSDKPDRVKVPYNIADENVRQEFEARYAPNSDPPIFSDRRIVPLFHGAGPAVFATDPQSGELQEVGRRFCQWLDEHPGRPWGMMMNYAGDTPIGARGLEAFQKYRDRYVGSIAGESLGYFDVPAPVMQAAVSGADTRRQLAEAISQVSLAANAAKYRQVFGKDVDANAYADVISCLSVNNIAFAPLCADWALARSVTNRRP